ncbi:peptidyl-tRNA hydrolase 2, mitochondrial [Quillaja saponaria]|uniref:peptidyl-tRNA hydrolase n=1 Tax=Quillaja saponaria TaxID=32244 RepID=A0AAD7LIK7_QUISA|nr:peptidyl-tRNA hydrolase 2, mitochondrial [Quillaja saponaria]
MWINEFARSSLYSVSSCVFSYLSLYPTQNPPETKFSDQTPLINAVKKNITVSVNVSPFALNHQKQPMVGSFWKTTQPRAQQHKQEKEWLAVNFRPDNFIPGLVIGFIFGLLLDLSKPNKNHSRKNNLSSGKLQQQCSVSSNGDQELKMVLVVRQDLKMKSGKIASQCAHAATGMYAELMQSQRSLLRQWEQCGQPKIVVTCKNQQEMNRLREAAESIGLPTFVVADAGRTQVSAGSRTVLAVGPGPKASVDSVTGKLSLL